MDVLKQIQNRRYYEVRKRNRQKIHDFRECYIQKIWPCNCMRQSSHAYQCIIKIYFVKF